MNSETLDIVHKLGLKLDGQIEAKELLQKLIEKMNN